MSYLDERMDRTVTPNTDAQETSEMKDTEQDVERVAEAIFNETVDYPAWDDLPDTWDSSYGPGKDYYRSIARAAMEAMERVPQPFPSMVGDRDALRELIYDDPILTDDQKREVYRIAEAIRVRVRSNYPELWDIGDRPDAWAYPARILLGMVPRPLEDVLREQHVYNIQIEPAGPNFYAEVVSAAHDRRTGTGATIADAIRAAVAAANEGTP